MPISEEEKEMNTYGGEWIFDKNNNIIGPLFGKDFVNAPWNRAWAGKRVYDPHANEGWGKDEWCYVNRWKGCTDFYKRNYKKLQEYLEEESKKTISSANRGNLSGGKRTRRFGKKTRKLMRTRKR